jgi:hypothetical protein
MTKTSSGMTKTTFEDDAAHSSTLLISIPRGRRSRRIFLDGIRQVQKGAPSLPLSTSEGEGVKGTSCTVLPAPPHLTPSSLPPVWGAYEFARVARTSALSAAVSAANKKRGEKTKRGIAVSAPSPGGFLTFAERRGGKTGPGCSSKGCRGSRRSCRGAAGTGPVHPSKGLRLRGGPAHLALTCSPLFTMYPPPLPRHRAASRPAASLCLFLRPSFSCDTRATHGRVWTYARVDVFRIALDPHRGIAPIVS